jgi:rubrerythrin
MKDLGLTGDLYRCGRCGETAQFAEEPDECRFCGSEEVRKA